MFLGRPLREPPRRMQKKGELHSLYECHVRTRACPVVAVYLGIFTPFTNL